MIMKHFKLTIIATLLIVITACNSANTRKEKKVANTIPKQEIGYPKIVDSLGVQELYDKTKWQMYLLKCDDTPKLENDSFLFTPPKSFASLDLKFDSLWQRNDSIAFYFDFYVNDTQSVLELMNKRSLKKDFCNGMLFYKGMDSLLFCYVSNHTDVISIYWTGPVPKQYYDTTTNRTVKPLQPKVAKYINENKSELNPWFYKEAIKRGVIKE